MEIFLNNTKVYREYWTEEAVNAFTDIISQDKPMFINRAGGCDYDAAVAYYNDNSIINNDEWYLRTSRLIKTAAGYFDFTDKQRENFKDYMELMVMFYENSEYVTYANPALIDQFAKNEFKPNEKKFLEHVLKDKITINYTFIEAIRPFLRSFDKWAEGKKILIVSPLSKSIEHQFKNKDNLYLDYKFPNFELKTYNTKITYNEPGDTKEIIKVNTNNWHEECQRMASEINTIDFDVAFLTCAVYAPYLGNFICESMRKKAIFFGGVLNVYFNIYGGRFDNYYGFGGLNPETLIDPFENDDIVHLRGGRSGGWSESLNAYFGRKKK